MDIKTLITDLKLDPAVFTEAVVDKMSVVIESQLSEAKEAVEKELSEYQGYLVDQLSSYLDVFVTDFTENNSELIEDSVKVKTAEKILEKFDGIVNEFNMDLKEDTIESGIENDDLKEQLNKVINEKLELQEQLQSKQVEDLISEVASEISTESKKEKFKTLAEGLSFTDESSFKEKLQTLSESIVDPAKTTKEEETLEDAELTENQTLDIPEKQEVINEETANDNLLTLLSK